MSLGINNDAEVAMLSQYFNNNSVEVGLYNDADDDLQDSETVSDIATEPTGSNYSRQQLSSGSISVSSESGSGIADAPTVTFNTSDSPENVDSAFFYNSDDDFLLRVAIDTSPYPNDYIDLSQSDNLQIGGDALILE